MNSPTPVVPNRNISLSPIELISMVETALRDHAVDPVKMNQVIDLVERVADRQAEREFNVALVDAASEMRVVFADSNNPQTRSRYASFTAVWEATTPIAAHHGLQVSFSTEPGSDPNTINITATLRHRGGHKEVYHLNMPRENKGARGGDVMTLTHATGSALTYGKRYLLLMIFNVAIDEPDDDGNRAGARPPPAPRPAPQPAPMDEHIDPETGEVLPPETPGMIELTAGKEMNWARTFISMLRRSATIDQIHQWRDLNTANLTELFQKKPNIHASVMKYIEEEEKRLAKV